MKPLPALTAVALVLALVLAPAVAAAGSITISSPTAGSSFKGTQAYTISGTVSPAPQAADEAYISVTNPSGTSVDAASATVNPTTGAFSYSTATGGSDFWVSGTYTITVTDSLGATGSSTFSYTAVKTTTPTTTVLQVQAVAMTPVFAGQTVQVTALVSFTNGTLATATWTGSHYHAPSGTPTALSAPTTLGPGMYMWTIALPSNAADGLYSVHLEANASGFIAWGVAGFTVNSQLASASSIASLATVVGNINTVVGNIQNSVSQMSTTLSSITQAANSAATAAGNAATQAQNAANAVSSTQTYVLVVAVLAAITLVLELAILVRKVS